MQLKDIIDLEAQLARDQAAEDSDAGWESVLARDRAIAKKIRAADLGADAKACELFPLWLDQIRKKEKEPLPGEKVASSLKAVRAVLLILGLLLGLSTVAGLKSAVVAGTVPYINVQLFWLVLIGSQLLLLVGLVLAQLCQAVGLVSLARILQPFQNLVASASGGMVQRVLDRHFADYARALTRGLRRVEGKRFYYGRISQWLLVHATQRFALAFNLGALGALLLFGNIEQLNFGWSTTRNASQWMEWAPGSIARPWRSLKPDAVPDAVVVRSTQFYPGTTGDDLSRGAMETWWRFMLMNLLIYGLAIRLILALFSRWRLHAALQNIPLHHEAFQRLQGRLTKSYFVEQAGVTSSALLEDEGQTIVVWGTLPDTLRPAIKTRMEEIHSRAPFEIRQAGHLPSLEQEEALCEILAAKSPTRVLIMIPEWNEPTGELKDFLHLLRAQLGEGPQIVIDLVDLGEDGRLRSIDAKKKMNWETFLNSVNDPRLHAMASEDSA
jgi:hypothetical protein